MTVNEPVLPVPDEATPIPVKIITPNESNDETTPSDTIDVDVSTEPTDTETIVNVSAEEIAELTRQLAEVQQKADSHWDSLLRLRAETENFRKRTDREVDNARKYALEKFATELLSVKDSLDMGLDAANKPEVALETVRDGLALTAKMLASVLEKFGVQEINPQNEKFNPQWHEAMAMQPVPNVAEGTVIHVHQKGYQLNERLLRPARVLVAKAIEIVETTEKPLENEG